MAARPRKKAGAKRRTAAAKPRLLPTLIVTGLLVVIGFGTGLLAGALWETPATLLGPFRGEAQVVDLSPLQAPLGDALAPEGESPEPVARVVQASAVAKPPPSVAAPPPPEPAGPFAIQVGSFEEPVPAWKLAEQLGEKDYAVYVDEGEAAGMPRWRVRVGPVPDRAQADRLARKLKSDERLPTWIIAGEKRG